MNVGEQWILSSHDWLGVLMSIGGYTLWRARPRPSICPPVASQLHSLRLALHHSHIYRLSATRELKSEDCVIL